MKILFTRAILIALVAALASLGVASLPFVSVSAAGAKEPGNPPQGEVSNEKLEKVWAHQLRVYEKMGKSEEFVAKMQQLIDRAKENGKDVSAVQAALDAFEDAAKDAKPVYESAQGIINSHEGFDANGKVTDPEKAKETVRAMGEKLKEIKDAMGGTGKALRDAIQAFREANPRPEKTPAP